VAGILVTVRIMAMAVPVVVLILSVLILSVPTLSILFILLLFILILSILSLRLPAATILVMAAILEEVSVAVPVDVQAVVLVIAT
jgi:hypothetical protein